MSPRATGFPPAEKFFPPRRTLPALARAVQDCRACPLYEHATQAVFGEGKRDARLVMVGEVPGDQEDLQGHVFVGAAGRMLDCSLAEVGLPREELWLTNAVKHFKFEPRGKRRIHKKPRASEIGACRPWLDLEIALIKPRVIVCLGATAAQALLGPQFKVTARRGVFVPSPLAPRVLATVHPSSILRAPDEETRRSEMTRFTRDLRTAAGALLSE